MAGSDRVPYHEHGHWLSLARDYGGPHVVRRESTLVRSRRYPTRRQRKCIKSLSPSYCLVRPYNNCPLSKVGLQTVIKKIARRAGLKKVTPHTLRCRFATHMHDHGAAVEIVQALMGHVWIQTTMKYARISPDRLAKDLRKCHPREKLNG